MRFKLDENLPAEAVELLRGHGLDAVSVLDQSLGGRADEEIAEVCRAEGRTLLTFDLDFANIRRYPPSQAPGIVVFRLRHQATPHLLTVLRRILPMLGREETAGRLWIVDEDRIRIRR